MPQFDTLTQFLLSNAHPVMVQECSLSTMTFFGTQPIPKCAVEGLPMHCRAEDYGKVLQEVPQASTE